MTYYTRRETTLSFDEAVDHVREALAAEGFGVLTDVDLQATFEQKLGVRTGRHRILGACNPELARRGLDAAPDLSVLLPCNVVVREDADGRTVVSAVDPVALLAMVNDADLETVATDVADRFERVIASLPEAPGERRGPGRRAA